MVERHSCERGCKMARSARCHAAGDHGFVALRQCRRRRGASAAAECPSRRSRPGALVPSWGGARSGDCAGAHRVRPPGAGFACCSCRARRTSCFPHMTPISFTQPLEHPWARGGGAFPVRGDARDRLRARWPARRTAGPAKAVGECPGRRARGVGRSARRSPSRRRAVGNVPWRSAQRRLRGPAPRRQDARATA